MIVARQRAVVIPDLVPALRGRRPRQLAGAFIGRGQLDLVRPLLDHPIDLRPDIARRLLQLADLALREIVALEAVVAALQALAAGGIREDVPGIDPARGRLHALADLDLDTVAGGIRHHVARRLGIGPLQHPDPDARRIEDHLAHLGRVLALDHPVEDPRLRPLRLLPRQLDVLLREVLHRQRDLWRARRCWCLRRAGSLCGLRRPGQRHVAETLMHHLRGVLPGLNQLRQRRLGEAERLFVERQQDLAELCRAGVDVAGGQPHERGRLVLAAYE